MTPGTTWFHWLTRSINADERADLNARLRQAVDATDMDIGMRALLDGADVDFEQM